MYSLKSVDLGHLYNQMLLAGAIIIKAITEYAMNRKTFSKKYKLFGGQHLFWLGRNKENYFSISSSPSLENLQ